MKVILIRRHKASYKESLNVKNIKDIEPVKEGRCMSKIMSSTYNYYDAFL